jgi:hypothetical protein
MEKRLLKVLVVLTGLFLLSASIVWAEPPAPIAKTGQTLCYTDNGIEISCAGTGQDGEYQKGVASPSPRFTDNGDGTVTDNLTGLMWKKDTSTSRMGNTAIEYANNLSLGSSGCGSSYTDWRLPNIKELQSLIDFGNFDPALPTGHPFINYSTASYSYWSSTAYTSNTDYVHVVSLLSATNSNKDKTSFSSYRVWPVRSGNYAESPAPVAKTGQTLCYSDNRTEISCAGTGQDGEYQKGVASPSPRFTDNGDGTVTDNLTGLMWAKDVNLFGPRIWSNALTDVNNLSLGSSGCGSSYTDWRLPNIKELQSLIDFGNYGPALPPGHPFINYLPTSTKYWSSTTYDLQRPELAFYVNLYSGGITAYFKLEDYLAWPVRSAD